MKTPLPVSAISGDEIEAQARTNIFDIITQEPGVGAFNFSAQGAAIQIRGISALNGDAIVGYYLDEFPFVSGISVPDVNPFDLERIEILRGPQGTLFGFGSLAGTVRILTKDPDLNDFQVKAAGSYASLLDEGDSTYTLNGAVNIPIVEDMLAVRAVVSHRQIGGFLDNATTGEKDINGAEITSFRGKVLFQPADNLSIKGMVWLNRADLDGQNFGTVDRVALTENEELANDYELYNLEVKYEFSALEIVSSTSILEADRTVDSIFSLIGGDFVFVNETAQDNFTQEFRFSTDFNGSVNINGGMIYIDNEQVSVGVTDFAGFRQNAATITTSESWAVFGEAHLDITEALTFTAGLRYFEDKRSVSEKIQSSFGDAQLPDQDLGAVNAKFSAFSPRFNLAYDVNDDVLIYANIARGFRSGQIIAQSLVNIAANSGVIITDPFVNPDIVWNYEIGGKGRFLDGLMEFDIAAYFTEWSGVQITVPIVAGSTGIPANGADAEVLGVDFGVTLRPLKGLSLTATGNVNNAKFVGPIPNLGIEPGDQLDNSIRNQFSGDITYTRPLTPGGDLDGLFNVNLQHNSAREIRGFGVEDVADPITIMNARLGVQTDRWGVFLTGTNLLDERGATGGTGGNFLLRLEPRAIGISGNVNF
ncbi:MAG: TonB-dependent receptor [Parvularcula sp.]|nr:TonB-dependent receptor [Parvularcula sp.]